MAIAPTNCLVAVSVFLSLAAWIGGIIALSSSEWYEMSTSRGKATIGAFNVCGAGRVFGGSNTTSESDCESVAGSAALALPPAECGLSSQDVSSRFSSIQALGIVAIVLSVLATALLIASFAHGLYVSATAAHSKSAYGKGNNNGFSEMTSSSAAAVPNSPSNPTTNKNTTRRGIIRGSAESREPSAATGPRRHGRSVSFGGVQQPQQHHNSPRSNRNNNNDDDDDNDSVYYDDDDYYYDDDNSQQQKGAPSRAPILEIIAFALQLASVGTAMGCSFYFLSTVESWLFCDEKPCAFMLSGRGSTVSVSDCQAGPGWALALALLVWVAGILTLVALGLRWFLRDTIPDGAAAVSTTSGNNSPYSGSFSGFPAMAGATAPASTATPPPPGAAGSRAPNNAAAPTAGPTRMYYDGSNNNKPIGNHPRSHSSSNAMGVYSYAGRRDADGAASDGGSGYEYAGKGGNTTDAAAGGAFVVVNGQQQQRETDEQQQNLKQRRPPRSLPQTPRAAALVSPAEGGARAAATADTAAADTVALPEGEWEWDEESQLYWSVAEQYYYDPNSGHFYEPESGQWYNPSTDSWYNL